MKISHKGTLSLVLFLFTAITAFSQNDYIIKTNSDSIGGITITSYPVAMTLTVNAYNKRLNVRYEDFQVNYTKPDGEKESEAYSNVRSVLINGIKYTTWHARKVPYTDGRIEFNKIIEIPGKSKEQLYTLARSWLIGKMGLTADAIQKYMVEDKENGIMTINSVSDGLISMTPYDSPTFSYWINYDLTVKVKDNKCRISFANFRYHYETGKIFDNKFIEKNNIRIEDFANDWKSSGGAITSHWYQGLMMMFYCAEDKGILDFEKKLLIKDDW